MVVNGATSLSPMVTSGVGLPQGSVLVPNVCRIKIPRNCSTVVPGAFRAAAVFN